MLYDEIPIVPDIALQLPAGNRHRVANGEQGYLRGLRALEVRDKSPKTALSRSIPISSSEADFATLNWVLLHFWCEGRANGYGVVPAESVQMVRKRAEN